MNAAELPGPRAFPGLEIGWRPLSPKSYAKRKGWGVVHKMGNKALFPHTRLSGFNGKGFRS
jgi:hypothetical protein